MDHAESDDWKNTFGFKINYKSDQSSDDDHDLGEVVMRRTRGRQSSGWLLKDDGDGSEADLLGTTPPRARIRTKEKRRNLTDGDCSVQKIRESRKTQDVISSPEFPVSQERLKKRLSLKMLRTKERDWKQDMVSDAKADSMPSPTSPVAPLVESCSRFMSLSSRLKCREVQAPILEYRESQEVPESRVTFHNTFSMLINMGNVEKGCRRTISREEQVWQNELKDMIWLELQAKLAGRTLAQQDMFLCTQRNVIPSLIQNIIEYKYVNPNPCNNPKHLCTTGSKEDLCDTNNDGSDNGTIFTGCVSFTCQPCTAAVSAAMKELSSLLDAYHNAVSLYPSTKAMTQEHPLIATAMFRNRIQAMCLWYNTALHMRYKICSVLRLVRTIKKNQGRHLDHLTSTDSDASRASTLDPRVPCQVRFNLPSNPGDSSNSDLSSHSDGNRSDIDTCQTGELKMTCQSREADKSEADNEDSNDLGIEKFKLDSGQQTPQILLDKCPAVETVSSVDSGYSSSATCDYESLAELTDMRLFDRCKVSPFRRYHTEILKTQGVRRCMMFINNMRKNILFNTFLTLEKPDQVPIPETTPDHIEVFQDSRPRDHQPEDDVTARVQELKRYGCWSEESLAMRLPSYRNHFLLLSCVCMEVCHDYLSMRLEDRPEQPSCLTVKQLIHELREGLDIATEMRLHFAKNVEVALKGYSAGAGVRADLLMLLKNYDDTVDKLLEQYMSYVKTMSAVEALSRSQLQSEWAFAAALASRRRSVASRAPAAFAEISCNQIGRLVTQFKNKFNKLHEIVLSETNRDEKQTVYFVCREAQSIFVQEREATLQAAKWARALSTRLARAPPPAFLRERIDIFKSLMSMRDCIVSHLEFILEKSCQSEDELPSDAVIVSRVRELLLQGYKLGFELHKELFYLVQEPFQISNDARRRSRPVSLQPVRRHNFERRQKRPETIMINESVNPMIHKELHRFVKDQSKRNPAAKYRNKFHRSESTVDDDVFDERMFEQIRSPQPGQVSIEHLLGGEDYQTQVLDQPSPQLDAPACNETERQWARDVAYAIVNFAKCWMSFVVDKCSSGRGRRPRWASQGLEFLMLACDPNNTKHLTDEEFEDLKARMDGCISHVVGSRGRAPSPPAHRARPLQSPLPNQMNNMRGAQTPPTTPPPEQDPLLLFRTDTPTSHQRRVWAAIAELEASRSKSLNLGKVLSRRTEQIEPKLKQVTFKWQRGLKIGAGTFGKVYTVVNTETGQLLAMKELSVVAGDRRALQKAANEMRVLEGVVHPHLVTYYGAELHREEMLIFMELCVEGSLEALICSSGGLAELTVRRYTKQLVSAIAELHARNIVHRDIKSGNIFLTNEGNCLNLGDFGCAVKIRGNTTAPGELQGFVGTQAYMAPEVFMKSSGHGRAADIWSLGCVVTEMASGQRPFSEYDSNYQIMFVVGMGSRPAVPESLSREGRQFCLACLTHEPDHRPQIDALQHHHFLMVKSDDECKCEPSYLMT